MRNPYTVNRRRFLGTAILGTAGRSLVTGGSPRLEAAESLNHDLFKGLKMGVASYSLRNFSLDQVIVMMPKLGVRYITLKDMHLPLDSTPAQRKEARQKLEHAGLILMGGGVIYMKNDPAEIRLAFEYARDAGMPTIVASPDPASLDILDKMVEEFDIRVAIHNHGPGDDKYPSPLDVMKLIKNHDPRIGVCPDIGHTARLGLNPLEAIRQCSGRIYDFHLKDVTAATPEGENIELGKGVINIVAVLRTLLEMKYQQQVALEYEIYPEDPLPGMRECFGYARGVLAVIN
jgi:inosose dehydratase